MYRVHSVTQVIQSDLKHTSFLISSQYTFETIYMVDDGTQHKNLHNRITFDKVNNHCQDKLKLAKLLLKHQNPH